MGIRTYKPTSPGRRNSSVSDFAELTDKNKKPEKSLTEPLQKTGAGTTRASSPRATAAAATSGSTGSSIGCATIATAGRRRDSHRIRSQPLGANCSDPVRRRREDGTFWRPMV